MVRDDWDVWILFGWTLFFLVLILGTIATVLIISGGDDYVVVGEEGVRVTETTTLACTVVDGVEDCEVVNKTREMEEWQWGDQAR